MAAKMTALVLKINDKIRISYHESQDAASGAASKIGTYQEGYMIDGLPDIEDNPEEEGMTLETARLTIDKLGGVEDLDTAQLDDVSEARRWVWQLLLAKLPDNPEFDQMYGAAATAEAPGNDDPAADLSNEEESELTDTSTDPGVTRKKPAPAPAKKAATAAKKPAPAPAKKAVAVNGAKKPAPAPAKKAAPAPAAKKAAPVAAKKAAPAAKAAKAPKAASNGEYRISDSWRVILKELGKKGAKGMTRQELIDVAKANGAGGWFGRFVTAGIIDRLDRGQFKLSDAGKAAIAAK